MKNIKLIEMLVEVKSRKNPPGKMFYTFDGETLDAIILSLKIAKKMARLLKSFEYPFKQHRKESPNCSWSFECGSESIKQRLKEWGDEEKK